MSSDDSVDIFWYLPTQGDERYLGTSLGQREPTFDYLRQVAQAVDSLGFGGMLLGTGTKLDPFVVATALAPLTRQLKYLIALRPSIMSPALCARMTATLDQISEGRALLNIVTGASTEQLEGDGVFLDHDRRYELTDEFLEIWLRLMHGELTTFEGRHLRIRNGRQQLEPVQRPHPPLFFGGSSPAALDVAARHIDHYLTWGEPPALARQKIDEVRARAAEQGRTLKYGIRMYVIVRPTEEEAWRAAECLIQHVDDAQVAQAQARMASSESEGQRRMASLRDVRANASRSREALEVYPNLWAGVGLVRGGAGTALVGTPEQVADRIREYRSLGFETFVLSGYPALEEAYWLGELVFPLLNVRTAEKRNPPTPQPRVLDAHTLATSGGTPTNGSGAEYVPERPAGMAPRPKEEPVLIPS